MPEQSAVLKYTPGQPVVQLRELCGADELAVEGVGTRDALRLLDRLLEPPGISGNGALQAGQMVTADRDGLLAAIYHGLYGPKVESTVNCRFCAERFDLDFSLQDLQAHLLAEKNLNCVEKLEDGTYRLASGARFRLPAGEDELAIAGHPPGQAGELLLKRCLLDGEPGVDGEPVQEAMEQLAPVLQTEISARCPECGQEQAMQFDIQTFLLTRLKNERKQTTWEIHRLAAAYKWSHPEILNLPRNLRKLYVSYIQSELPQ